MVIYGLYVVSKSGGLIFNYDHKVPKIETERRFNYPLDVKLKYEHKKVSVEFGQKDGVQGDMSFKRSLKDLLNKKSLIYQNREDENPKSLLYWFISYEMNQQSLTHVGHILTGVNKMPVTGRQLDDGRDVVEVLENRENYPLTLKFSRPKMTTNEKIFLASMFYPLFAMASQLSPEPKCSGIEILEADTFRLQCFQTLTGVKIMVVADPKQLNLEIFLKKVYELYADYALKNPFYSLEMPIRCELFDINLKSLLEQIDKSGITSIN